MASRLAEIYRSEKKSGGGLGSAIGKTIGEKIDPRRALDQSGLLVSMFPSLKAYKATKGPGASKISSGIGGSGIDSGILNSLVATSSLTAKNSMSLPMMARDMNLMKLNIFKLVKLQGGKANTNKTDIFWKNAKDREAEYGNTIGKGGGTGIADVAGGVLTASVLKTLLTSTLSFLTGPIGLTMLGGAALFGTIKTLMDKNADKEGVDLTKNILGGALDDSQSGAEIMAAAAEGEAQRKKEDEQRRTASGQLQKLPQTTLPDTGAGGGRGFVNPDLVTPVSSVEQVPSNAVLSGSGAPIMTGSGGYVTSGEIPSAPMRPTPTSTIAPSSMTTSPSKLDIPDKTIGDYIKDASKRVGVDEGIMLAMAKQESSFNPSAKPIDKNGKLLSSAKGLYQFIDSTWSLMVSKYSKNFPELLKGPMDPLASAIAGALYIKENGRYLASRGIPITGTSIYASHFLGPGGAEALFTANPSSDASQVLPAAASSNKHIFYNKDKTPKSVEGVIQTLYSKVGKSAEQYTAALSGAGGSLMASSNSSMPSASATFITPSKPSVSPSMPSTGTAVASASTSVSDQRMAAMAPSGGNTVINNKPTTVASTTPSSGGKTASTYDNELFQTLVGYQSMGA